MTSTARIITQNTSSHDQTPPKNLQQQSTISENFIKNEQQAQAPPQPAPRTRLSSQNSIPMTNGDGAKADDAAQVRTLFRLKLGLKGEKVKACRRAHSLVVNQTL
jgi:hypothetical protein